MDDVMVEIHLENLDRRLTSIVQILPTLATKEDLQAAVAPLATKEELQAAIALLATKDELRAAIAPLATKEELRSAIEPLATNEMAGRLEILIEAQRDDLRLLAEAVATLIAKVDAWGPRRS